MPKQTKRRKTPNSPIYAASRQQEILKLLNQDSSVNVDRLADQFGVSKASIRRDLRALRDQSLLQRTYGGAVRPATSSYEASFNERRVSYLEEKLRIGEQATRYIQPGMTVFIDGGTTAECMIPYLLDKRITAVTQGLNIITRLAGAEQITVISTGGTLNHQTFVFSGVLALDSFHAYNVRFDIAFMACSAISAEAGATNATFESIPMKRKAIQSAQRSILLADSSKVGCVAAGLIVPATKFERLITGADAPAQAVQELKELGLVVDLV